MNECQKWQSLFFSNIIELWFIIGAIIFLPINWKKNY